MGELSVYGEISRTLCECCKDHCWLRQTRDRLGDALKARLDGDRDREHQVLLDLIAALTAQIEEAA